MATQTKRAVARPKPATTKAESTDNLPALIEPLPQASLSAITQDGIKVVFNLFELEHHAHAGRIGFLDAIFRIYQAVELSPEVWDEFHSEFRAMRDERRLLRTPDNSSLWNRIIMFLLAAAFEASGDPDSQEREVTKQKVVQVENMRSWYLHASRAILWRLKYENDGRLPPYQPGTVERLIHRGIKLPDGTWECSIGANGQGRGTINRLAEQGRYLTDQGLPIDRPGDDRLDDDADRLSSPDRGLHQPPILIPSRRKQSRPPAAQRRANVAKQAAKRAALGFTEEPDGKPSTLRHASETPEPIWRVKEHCVKGVSEGCKRYTLGDLIFRAAHMFADNEAIREVSIRLCRTRGSRMTLYINGDAAEFEPWATDFFNSVVHDQSIHLILTPEHEIRLAHDAEVLMEGEAEHDT